MTTAIERLEALLDEKDEELEKLRQQVTELERARDSEPWAWMRQSKSDEAEGLPVPRLEIRWSKLDDWSWVAEYALVYRFFLGEVIRVPFSRTKQSGGWDDRELAESESPRSIVRNGVVETPFRDGAHIRHDMRALNLPGYAICRDVVTKLEPMDRPAPYEQWKETT